MDEEAPSRTNSRAKEEEEDPVEVSPTTVLSHKVLNNDELGNNALLISPSLFRTLCGLKLAFVT